MGNKQQADNKDDKDDKGDNKPEDLTYQQKLLQSYVNNEEVKKQLNTTGKLPFFNPNDTNQSRRQANNFDEFGNRTHDSTNPNAYGSSANEHAGLPSHFEEFQSSNDL